MQQSGSGFNVDGGFKYPDWIFAPNFSIVNLIQGHHWRSNILAPKALVILP